MESKRLLVVLVVLVCSMHSVWSQTTTITTEISSTTEITPETTTKKPFDTCTAYEGTQLDLEPLGGIWYETARAPNLDDMQCMNISVPTTVSSDNKIEVQFEYVDAYAGKWESANKSQSLDWNTQTQQGIFEWCPGEVSCLHYKLVTYKLVSTDSTTYAFFCGYIGFSPVPIFRTWTRNRHLSPEEKTAIQQKFEEVGQGSNMVWVEQSLDKCNNSAVRTAGGALVALALALFYRRNI